MDKKNLRSVAVAHQKYHCMDDSYENNDSKAADGHSFRDVLMNKGNLGPVAQQKYQCCIEDSSESLVLTMYAPEKLNLSKRGNLNINF